MVLGSCLGCHARPWRSARPRGARAPIRQAIKCSSVAGSSAQRRQASARCAPDRLRSSRAPRGRARRMWGPIRHSQVTFSDVRDDGFVGLAECAIIHAQIEVGSLRFDARQQQRLAASGARRAKPIYEFVFRDVWHGSLELAGAQHSQSPII
jgi:hypothetical protein